jgi:thiosulfate/3-mercaptopyruvate sulfurtransferase
MGEPLVSCAWLAERLSAPDIRILDATWFMPSDARDARALYRERRIPGAAFFDIDEIADDANPLPHMLPSPEKFASRMRKQGIGDGAHVIVYDNQGLFSAARVWWTFRVMGHDDVAVLDGGFPAWERAGLPVEDGSPSPRGERHFTARFRSDLVRSFDDMRRIVEAQNAPILDARPASRFSAEAPEPRPGLRGGHMPGAVNVPVPALITEDGFLRTPEELRAALGDAVSARSASACSCGSGIAASIVALALARLGRWDAGVYDGSWTEWGARADVPVVTGAP